MNNGSHETETETNRTDTCTSRHAHMHRYVGNGESWRLWLRNLGLSIPIFNRVRRLDDGENVEKEGKWLGGDLKKIQPDSKSYDKIRGPPFPHIRTTSQARPLGRGTDILDDVRAGSILDIDFLGAHQQNAWLRILFPNSVGMMPSVGGRGWGVNKAPLYLFLSAAFKKKKTLHICIQIWWWNHEAPSPSTASLPLVQQHYTHTLSLFFHRHLSFWYFSIV